MTFMLSLGYLCFIELPEALAPFWGPWYNPVLLALEHTFNVVCAVHDDPALSVFMRLYVSLPRALQFALSSLGSSDFISDIDCWACRDPRYGDAVLLGEAFENE